MLDDYVPAIEAVFASVGNHITGREPLVGFVGESMTAPTAVDANDLLGRMHVGHVTGVRCQRSAHANMRSVSVEPANHQTDSL